MAEKTLTVRQKQKYDTAANWTSNNPVLLAGELGIESDTNKFKVGDGTTNWSGLSYAGGGGSSSLPSNIAYFEEVSGTPSAALPYYTKAETDELVDEQIDAKGIKEINTQYIRITDLSTGIYKLTYNGTKYIYYSGTSSTSTHTVAGGMGSVILTVNRYGTTSWQWYYINGTTSYPTIYYGYTSSSSGANSSKALNNLLTAISSYVQNNLTYSTSNTTYALSAYQGYLLNQNKQDKLPTTTTAGQILKSTSTSGTVEWGAETDPVFSASAAAGITSADITSWNNAVVTSSGTNYIRYANGLQICWGTISSTSTSGEIAEEPFPQSFLSTSSMSVVVSKMTTRTDNDTWRGAGFNTFTNTSVSAMVASGSPKYYIAIGQWK